MITVYTKKRCMQCKYTKQYLDNNNIEYKIIDIEEKPRTMELLRHHGWQSLPVVSINDELENTDKTWFGFRPDKLEQLHT